MCGNDATFLINKGFDVTCVDKSPASKEIITSKNPNIKFISSSFEDLDFNSLGSFDLVLSSLGIIFCNKNYFPILIKNIKGIINKNGFFVGNFLGIKDDWNNEHYKSQKFFTEDEVLELFKDFKIYYICDKKFIKDSSIEKDKFWHIIEIYAQKN